MDILGIQLVGIIFGIVFIYLTFLNKKRDQISDNEAIFWIIIWIGLILASLFPWMLNFIVMDLLNVSRTLDFLIIVAFLVIFGIIYYMFVITKKTQNQMERLVRELALKRKNSKK